MDVGHNMVFFCSLWCFDYFLTYGLLIKCPSIDLYRSYWPHWSLLVSRLTCYLCNSFPLFFFFLVTTVIRVPLVPRWDLEVSPQALVLWVDYGTNLQSRVSHHNSLPPLLESLHRLFFLGISNPWFGLIGLPPKNLKGRKKVSKTRWCLLWWNFIFINLVEHYLISCSFLIGWMLIILLILVIFYSC